MKSTKIMGLCVAAAFAFGAIAAASASAVPANPFYEKCVKAEKVGKEYKGDFSNKKCEGAETPGGKYELKEAESGESFKVKGKGATFTVEGKTVKCTKAVGSGEITGGSALQETITFSKCDINGNKKETCGNITAGLGGELYYTSVADNGAELQLKGAHGRTVFEIECGSKTFKVEEYVLGAVSNGKSGETITFTVNQNGEQELRNVFESSGQINTFPRVLECNFGEATLVTTLEQKGPKSVAVYF